MTDTAKPKPQVKLLQLLAFCGPSLPFAALGLPLTATLPEYFATVLGMGGSAYTVFLWVRMFDIFVDPPLGTLMDKTRTPFGRFKLWILISVPILMISTWLVFMADKSMPALNLGIWLFVLYVGFSIAALAQPCWGGVLSSDYHERTRIFAAWQVANIVGVLLFAVGQIVLLNQLHMPYVQVVQALGIGIVVLLPITAGIAYLVVPERQTTTSTHDIRLSQYFDMWKIANVRRVLGADLFLGLAPGVMSALLYYFFMQAKGLSRGEAANVMAVYFIAGIFGAPLWSWMSKRLTKHLTLNISSVLFAFAYAIMAFLPKHQPLIAYAMAALAGLTYAASLLLTRALIADIGDEVISKTGHDHKGVMMAILSATTKLGYAISLSAVTILELYFGFDSKLAQNSEASLFWVQAAFVGLPVIFLILGILSMLGYDLTPERHQAVMKALEEKGISPSEVAPHGH